MEDIIKTKKVWKTPDIEIINSKMTEGGAYSWDREDTRYYVSGGGGYGS
jgi:hypothetical protein